eukprot:31177-Pelagococcus_subviridis.AAC.8
MRAPPRVAPSPSPRSSPRRASGRSPGAPRAERRSRQRHALRAAVAGDFAAHVRQPHARVARSVVREAVVVRRKQRPRAEIDEVAHDRVRDRGAVRRRGASAELVQGDEGVARRAAEHRRGLRELDHERGLPADDVVLGAHANVNRVGGGHREGRRGDVRADVRHDRGETHLSQQRALAAHVRAGVVRNERLPSAHRAHRRVGQPRRAQRRLRVFRRRRRQQHRRARLRAARREVFRRERERAQRVEARDRFRGALPPRPLLAKFQHEPGENLPERVLSRLLRGGALFPHRPELGGVETLEPFTFSFPLPPRRDPRGQTIRNLDQVRVFVRAHERDFALPAADFLTRVRQPLRERVVRGREPRVRGVNGRVRAGLRLDPPARARAVPIERALEVRERLRELWQRRARDGGDGVRRRVPAAALGHERAQRRRVRVRDRRADVVEVARDVPRRAHPLERSEKPVQTRFRRVLVQNHVRGVAASPARGADEPAHRALEIRRLSHAPLRASQRVRGDAAKASHRALPLLDREVRPQRTAHPSPQRPPPGPRRASIERAQQRPSRPAVRALQHLESAQRRGVHGDVPSVRPRGGDGVARPRKRLDAPERDQVAVEHREREIGVHDAKRAETGGAFARGRRRRERREHVRELDAARRAGVRSARAARERREVRAVPQRLQRVVRARVPPARPRLRVGRGVSDRVSARVEGPCEATNVGVELKGVRSEVESRRGAPGL